MAQSKAGADWQLSIGADVKECELVRSSREVNGQNFDGPFYHIRQAVLREISVIPCGADSKTTMKVTASFNLQPPTIKGEATTMANEELKPETKTEKTDPENTPNQESETKETKANTNPKEEPKIKKDPKKEPKAEADAAPSVIQAQAQDAAQQAVKAERERVAKIQTICAGDYPEIEHEAISAGWVPETVTSKVLATIRAERPSADCGYLGSGLSQG
ncbi:MAG: hypothetical protein KAS17_02920 [Victivallaceae bacterium]|nr:hypothetical protein [Victivallaceae bacterium]